MISVDPLPLRRTIFVNFLGIFIMNAFMKSKFWCLLTLSRHLFFSKLPWDLANVNTKQSYMKRPHG